MPQLDLPTIPPFDTEAARLALLHQNDLTKPPGSLGRLEELAVFYAGARGSFPVPPPRRAFLPVFGADHGVCVEGVSAFPAELTAAILQNVVSGGAGVSVLARAYDVELMAIDVGMTGDLVSSSNARIPSHCAKIRRGTRNLRVEDAMTLEEAHKALELGLRVAHEQVKAGAEVVGIGEVGIGNTTASAALIAAFTGRTAQEVTGRGSGIGDDALATKTQVIHDALLRIANRTAPMEIAAAVGGLEIVAMAGFIIGAASLRVPIVIDGVIAQAATLLAQALRPAVLSFCVASHRSTEPGVVAAVQHTGQRPLFDLGMRLGEGTGSILGISLLRTAVKLSCEMATFASAGLL